MPYTETSIANLALSFLGDRRINDIDDDDDDAVILKDNYDHAKNVAFEAHEWKWAKKQAVLQQDALAPIARYGYAYSKPADFARIVDVSDNDTMVPSLDDWEILGMKIITDAEALYISYVSNAWSEGMWPAYFAQVVAVKLAYLCAPRVSHAKADRDTLESTYQKVTLPDARVIDSQQHPPRKRIIRSNWSKSRFGYTYGSRG